MSFADLIADADRAVQGHLGGVAVWYQPEEGAAVEVVGMFDANYVLVDEGNAGVEQTGPAVWLRLEDLPVHPDDDGIDYPILTIGGQTYRVRERQPDTMGTIRLLLHRTEEEAS